MVIIPKSILKACLPLPGALILLRLLCMDNAVSHEAAECRGDAHTYTLCSAEPLTALGLDFSWAGRKFYYPLTPLGLQIVNNRDSQSRVKLAPSTERLVMWLFLLLLLLLRETLLTKEPAKS